MSVTHWLVVNVLPSLLRGAAATTGAAIAAGLIIQPFKGLYRKFHRALDSLDPETDTGVTRQLRLIHKAQTGAVHGKSA